MQDPSPPTRPDGAPDAVDPDLCQSCGACCSYSADWPRFTLEDDAEIARIPEAHVSPDGVGMRCEGVRCSALQGEVGRWTACGVYPVRPLVCRDCLPGDPECLMARERHGLPWPPERAA